MRNFFSYLTSKTSFAFASVVFADASKILTSLYGFFLVWSVPGVFHYCDQHVIWFLLTLFVIESLALYIHLGVFSRIGIKAWNPSVQWLNHYYSLLAVPSKISNPSALKFHKHLSDLSARLRNIGSFYTAAAIFLFVVFFYVHTADIKATVAVVVGGALSLAVYRHLMFVIPEYIIGPVRARLEQILFERRLAFANEPKTTLRKISRLIFIYSGLGTIILGYYTYSGHKSITDISLFITLNLVIFGMLFYFHLNSIYRFLNNFSTSIHQLMHNQDSYLYTYSVAGEITECARMFNMASRELVFTRRKLEKYSKVLERAVEDRTKELVRKNRELELKQSLIITNNEEIQAQTELIQDYNINLSQVNENLELQKIIIEQKNRDLTDSINYALRIQSSLLPSEEKLKRVFPHSFIFFKPRDIVSGDFYWFARVKDKMIMVVADCTGHGVPGALMSMIGITLLHRIVEFNGILRPSEILHKLDQELNVLLENLDAEEKSHDGMDVSICTIDFKTNRIFMSGAQRPLFIIRDGEIIEYSRNIFSVGGCYEELKKEFNEQVLLLKPKDMIYMFTDGYTSQFGGRRSNKFENRRFKKMLLDIHTLSLQEQRLEVEKIHHEWKGREEQIDDILLLGFRYEDQTNAELQSQVSSITSKSEFWS